MKLNPPESLSNLSPKPVRKKKAQGSQARKNVSAPAKTGRTGRALYLVGLTGSATIVIALAVMAIALVNLQRDVRQLPNSEALISAGTNIEELGREMAALREGGQELEAIRNELASLRKDVSKLETLRDEIAAMSRGAIERDGIAAAERKAIEKSLSEVQESQEPVGVQLMAFLAQKTPAQRKNFVSALAAVDARPHPPLETQMRSLLPPKDGLAEQDETTLSAGGALTEADWEKIEAIRNSVPLPEEDPPIAVAVSAASPAIIVPEHEDANPDTAPAYLPNVGTEEMAPKTQAPAKRPVPTAPEKQAASEPEAQASAKTEEEPKAAPVAKSSQTPEPEEEKAPVIELEKYTVQKGDSLSKIAKDHSVSLSALIKVNGITNPNKLALGQVLKIPAE